MISLFIFLRPYNNPLTFNFDSGTFNLSVRLISISLIGFLPGFIEREFLKLGKSVLFSKHFFISQHVTLQQRLTLINKIDNYHNLLRLLVTGLIILFLILIVNFFENGIRKIPVNYTKNVITRKVMGGSNTPGKFLPYRLNICGANPIIETINLFTIPSLIVGIINKGSICALYNNNTFFNGENIYFYILFVPLLIIFTYLDITIFINPADLANNLQLHGGYLIGVRPGKHTEIYLDYVISRLIPVKIYFLIIIVMIPFIINNIIDLNISNFIGITIMTITITIMEIYEHFNVFLLSRHFNSFLKTGKIRGRR